MNGLRAICRLTLGAVLLTGCDKKEAPDKSSVPTPPSPVVTPKAGGGVGMSGNGSGSASPVKSPAGDPSVTVTPGPATGPSGQATPVEAATGGVPGSASAKDAKDAQEQVAQAMLAMKESRYADARQCLDRLEAMQDKLLPTTREQLTTLRGNLASVERLQKTDVNISIEPDNK